MLWDETLKPFDYWPVWLQCVAVHVMRSSGSLWREQEPLSFHFKSRRWSQCGQGAGLVLAAQAQKNPCIVNPCVSARCELPQSLYFYRSNVRATGWAAVWQDPFKQVLPEWHQMQTFLFCWCCGSFSSVGCGHNLFWWLPALSFLSFSVNSFFEAVLKVCVILPYACPCTRVGCKIHTSAEVSSQIFLD